jgi:hypothetical protein
MLAEETQIPMASRKHWSVQLQNPMKHFSMGVLRFRWKQRRCNPHGLPEHSYKKLKYTVQKVLPKKYLITNDDDGKENVQGFLCLERLSLVQISNARTAMRPVLQIKKAGESLSTPWLRSCFSKLICESTRFPLEILFCLILLWLSNLTLLKKGSPASVCSWCTVWQLQPTTLISTLVKAAVGTNTDFL